MLQTPTWKNKTTHAIETHENQDRNRFGATNYLLGLISFPNDALSGRWQLWNLDNVAVNWVVNVSIVAIIDESH